MLTGNWDSCELSGQAYHLQSIVGRFSKVSSATGKSSAVRRIPEREGVSEANSEMSEIMSNEWRTMIGL